MLVRTDYMNGFRGEPPRNGLNVTHMADGLDQANHSNNWQDEVERG